MADLRYKALLDDSDYRKKFAALQRDTGKDMADMFDRVAKQSSKNVEDMLKRINTAVSKATGATSGTNETGAAAKATKELTARQKEAIETMRAEREARLATIEAIRNARLAIEEEKKSIQTAKREYEEGRKSINDYRLALMQANQAAKERAKAEREAKKALADNSEYQKLNRALGELRRQSKDVLAEMFRLERQGKKNSVAYQELANKARGLVAQTNVLDKGIKKIDASLGLHQRNVGNYGSALDAISPQFARINSQLAMMGVNLTEVAASRNGFQQLGATLLAVGKNIGAFLLSPLGLAITALGSIFMLFQRNKRTVIEFNAGLLNVSKTTGLAGAELDALSDSIINLSRSLQTVGTDKLLEYATIAGQLGVKGTENIMAFTEALAKLETASDISGEKGGAEIARLLTLVDGGVQNVARFGDEIVNLGNNFAATESEILSNAEAIAQNTGLYRIGRQEVLAYGTATKSLGIEAEVVGSSFQKTLGVFEKAIRTGKGLDGLLKVVGGTAQELGERFRKDASGVFQEYIRGLNGIFKAGGSVQGQLQSNGITDIRQTRVIGTLASSYETLEAAMNTVRDAAGALDQEFATKAASLENQTGRIKIAWDNLVLSIENGTGAIGRASVAVVDFFATVLEGITNVVTSSSWDEFFTRINPANWGKGDQITKALGWREVYDDILAFNKELQSMGSGSANWLENHFRGLNRTEFTKAFEQAEENYNRIKDAAIGYEAAVKAGLETENEVTVNHYKKQESLARLHLSRMNRLRSELGYTDASGAPATPEPVDEELTKQQQRELDARLKRQRDLQKQIDEMNRASLKATLDKDEQEVESVRDKYRKIRQTIDEFRRDPKNKGLSVDASGLTASEAREVAEVRYKQETTALMKELGIQRQLWQDYEAWRLELGEQSANERYSKELDAIKSFRNRIKTEMALIGAQLTASLVGGPAASALTGAETERLKQLQELDKQLIDADQKRRDANLQRVLKDYASFEKKRLRLHKDAEDDMALLDEEGRRLRKKALDDELLELYRTEVEGNERLQEFLKTADTAGSSVALRALKHGKDYAMKLIDGMTGDPKAKARLKKELQLFFDQGIASLEQENFGNVVSLVEGFGQLVESAMQFDGTLGNSLKTIGSMVSQVGQLARTLGDTLGKLGTGLSQGGGYAAIVGAVLSVIGSIAEAIDGASQRARQQYIEAQKYGTDFQLKQMEAVTKALERQLQLVNEIYGTGRIDEYQRVSVGAAKSFGDSVKDITGGFDLTIGNIGDNLVKAYSGEITEFRKYLLTGVKEYDDFIAKLNSGAKLDVFALSYLSDLLDKNVLKTLDLGFDNVEDITSEHLDSLYKLIDEGRLDEATQRQVENIIAQYDLWREANNQLQAELTGTTFQSITDEIVGMFREGKTAATDFAESFEKLMQNAILQSFKRKYLEEGLQVWYDEFAAATRSDDRLTQSEISDLQNSYNEIINNAREQFNLIKEATGVDFGDGLGKPESGLKSGIERMTEQTASEIAGLYRAMYDLTKNNGNQSLALMNSQLVALNSINNNTANTVARLDTAVTHLATLVINTTPQTATNYTGRP